MWGGGVGVGGGGGMRPRIIDCSVRHFMTSVVASRRPFRLTGREVLILLFVISWCLLSPWDDLHDWLGVKYWHLCFYIHDVCCRLEMTFTAERAFNFKNQSVLSLLWEQRLPVFVMRTDVSTLVTCISCRHRRSNPWEPLRSDTEFRPTN